METKEKNVKFFLGIWNALQINQGTQRKDITWTLGALDALSWARGVLWPIDVDNDEVELNKETLQALAELDSEYKRRFLQKIRSRIKQEFLIKVYDNALKEEVSIQEQGLTEAERLFRDISFILELYLQRRAGPDAWAEGALDSLRWANVTLYPFEENSEESEMHAKTTKVILAVHKEWQEKFQSRFKNVIKDDEMLIRITGL